MSLFNSLLSKIEERLNGNQKTLDEVSSTISSIVKVSIPSNKLIIKNGTLFCNSSPTIKTELLIKKEKILNELKMKGITIHTIV